eukprot:scaffold40110_cov53-Attheya_sp.AAC.3
MAYKYSRNQGTVNNFLPSIVDQPSLSSVTSCSDRTIRTAAKSEQMRCPAARHAGGLCVIHPVGSKLILELGP